MSWLTDLFVPAAVPDVFAKLPAALQAVAATRTPLEINNWCTVLVPPLHAGGFTTPHRVAGALGQMAVESQGFSAVSENLNYGAPALLASWPTHFSPADANAYAHQPERIANRAYANRMGNRNEASGDGWLYRGAGLIQLTGHDNQAEFARHAGMSVEAVGDYLRTPKGAAESAVWFLLKVDALELADAWRLTALSQAVNGGSAGLANRINLSNAALRILS